MPSFTPFSTPGGLSLPDGGMFLDAQMFMDPMHDIMSMLHDHAPMTDLADPPDLPMSHPVHMDAMGSTAGQRFSHTSPPVHSSPGSGHSSSFTSPRQSPDQSPTPWISSADVEGSLEFVPGAFSYYIGPTGVSDVHLISREPYDAANLTRTRVNGLRYRRMDSATASATTITGVSIAGTNATAASEPSSTSAPGGPTIFGITDQSLLAKAEPRSQTSASDAAWSELWAILDPQKAWRLLQLYARFIDPYFPILSRHQIPASADELSNMPLGILSAMCAAALPFIVYDPELVPLLLSPPSSQALYRLSWLGVFEELHAPSLTTLQACLLLQQRLPTNLYLFDTAFSWSLMATSVAVAQTIGLHRDPAGWASLPLWERRLRRRLWWALWTTEKWYSLARGMPTHLTDDDHDVAPLVPEDVSDTLSDSTPHTKTHLFYLVSLTYVLADILKTYYTVRATRQLSDHLHLSLEAARPLRVRLKAWKDSLPATLRFGADRATAAGPLPDHRVHALDSEEYLDGNGSLHLCYIVTHMSLFRALLRPLEKMQLGGALSEATGTLVHDGAKAVTRGAALCVEEFVEFVEPLAGAQWNAFWHSWSRANFAIAGAFMVCLLHLVAPGRQRDESGRTVAVAASVAASFEDEHRRLLEWIRRWRWANRKAVGASGMKGLTNLGLLRVETMLGNLGMRETS
jgi:hypothetical protein